MQIRVVTLNVWALPWGVSRDNAARMRAIADALAAQGADLFAFQEVWTAEARETLVAAGRKLGYPGVWHNPATRGGSGLLVISRFPIDSAHFTPFRARGLPQRVQHADYYGGKGFVVLGLSTPDGLLAAVDTHLHARYVRQASADEYQGHRMAQVIELCTALRTVDLPLIALGDFNVREDDPEYAALLGLAGLRDGAADLDAKQATVQAGSAYHTAGAEADERIDYVFTRGGSERGLRTVAVRRVFDADLEIEGRRAAYSDHAGLLAEIESASPAARKEIPNDAIEIAHASLERGRSEARARRTTQRIESALGFAGAGLTVSAARLPSVSRRRMLHKLVLGAGGALALGGTGLLTLSELFVPDELRAFDAASEQLEQLAPAPSC